MGIRAKSREIIVIRSTSSYFAGRQAPLIDLSGAKTGLQNPMSASKIGICMVSALVSNVTPACRWRINNRGSPNSPFGRLTFSGAAKGVS